jgi:opacity protein-like surface antigen
MKTSRRILLTAALALAGFVSAHAADLAGKWKSEFDSQVGQQKYTYEFKGAGDKLTGTASGERQDAKSEVALTEIKVTKDEVSFVELLKIQDQEVRVEYKGKFTGDDELKLTRKVGDFATYDIVAKRVK